MTQTSNRFFDEIGRLMNDAAGAAQGVKREVDTVVRNQAEKILRDLDIVKRGHPSVSIRVFAKRMDCRVKPRQ